MSNDDAKSRLQPIKDALQIALLVFGAGFGVYTFIYKDIYVPARRPPAVTLTAAIEELDRADGMVLVRATVQVANRGDGKVWVPALWWNVYGVRFKGLERTSSEFAQGVRAALNKGDADQSRFSDASVLEILAVGREPDYQFWFEPKDETLRQHLFLVPEGRFEGLEVWVEAIITKEICHLAQTRWDVDHNAELTATLMMKPGFFCWGQGDASAAPFDEHNAKHMRRTTSDEMGHNYTVASLRLKPSSSASQPMRPAATVPTNTGSEKSRTQ